MKRKKIKTGWAEYFNFSMRERRGAALLAVILIIQIGVLYFLKHQSGPYTFPNPSIVSELLRTMKDKATEVKTIDPRTRSKETQVTLSVFNPNTLDDSSGARLGFNERQIKVIRNYLSRGGKFRVKNDFKKMYCIKPEEYKVYEPYIDLPDTIQVEHQQRPRPIKKTLIIDVGEADSTTLLSIRGIGPAFASRIVRFREKLGGFYSMEQLKEVWGFNDTIYNSILPFIDLKSKVPFRFIHLNTDSFSILSSHPYIRGKIAALICKYRKQHLAFNSIDELKQLPLVTEENFRKLAPYLMPD